MQERFELIQETQTRYRIFVMSKSFTGVEGWICTNSFLTPLYYIKWQKFTNNQDSPIMYLEQAIERIQVRHPELSIKNLNKNAA